MTIEWNADWSHTRAHWPAMFEELGLIGKPNLRFLEIGCFEGQSALWTLENVLTDPSSMLTIIDPLEFSEINGEDQRERLERHLAAHRRRVDLREGRSQDILRARHLIDDYFDFVYVDGDHYPIGVLADAVLAWPLIKPGGHMLFDDYVETLGGHRGPRPAIDAFVDCFEFEIESHQQIGMDQYIVHKGDWT